MTDYIETYRKIPVDKIVEFDETPGFGPWKDLFSSESTKHPAKANLNMLRFLIERFTKPGDVILDPMSGTGSTGTMANLHGRNAILVEYEEKFADMCKDNMEIVKKKPGLHKGSTLVIQGDARELSSILKEKVDFTMFGPPYANPRSTKGTLGEDDYEDNRNLQNPCGRGSYRGRYSSNGDNIGDRPYGDVDAVLTSPPHGDTSVIQYDNPDWTKHFQAQLKEKGHIEWEAKKYSEEEWRALNHGRIDGRTMRGMKKGKVGYSPQEENLGNLPYGKVSAVITSPPYEGTRPWKAKDYEKFSEGMEERTRDGRMKRNFATAEAQQRYVDKMQEGAQMTEGNIAQERGKTYLEAMLQVYSESHAVLKPGGLMIIIVKNFVRNWKPVRLDLDTIKLCKHIGFELADHLYRRLKQKSFWIRNYEKQFRKKFPDLNVPLPTAQFEDILIFQKPTPL